MPARLVIAALLLGLAMPARAQAPATPERIVGILNRATTPITVLYVSTTEEENWGTDRLAGQAIAPGRSLQLRLGPSRACRFDLQAVYGDGRVEERRDQDICRGRQVVFDASHASPLDDRTERRVNILNATPRAIRQVFLSPRNAPSWGDELLNGAIAAGASIELTYRGDCIVDIRIVYDNAAAEERREADLCAHPSLRVSPGWTLEAELPNRPGDGR